MSDIMYTPFRIGNLQIPNRLVASAVFEYGAEDGKITDRIRDRYRALADGGAGLIITGMHAVSHRGAIGPAMVSTDCDGYVRDLGDIVEEIHSRGSRIFVQLQHCGPSTCQEDGYDRFTASDTQVSDRCRCHAATAEEIGKVVSDFAAAALRCRQAGADGVQIHAAHGFLISRFLSPSSNRRQDGYGGDAPGRARLLLEICDAVRSAVGDTFPVGVKFQFHDLNGPADQAEDSVFICRELERRGIDFLEISAGMVMDGSPASFVPVVQPGEEPPFLSFAVQAARAVSVPVISVCGYAAVSFGRPLIREPDLPTRWREDTRPAACISCNRCRASFGDGIITCYAKKDPDGTE